jgi:acyl-CoA thioester hydrolase|tara:strand:+ start:3872 stop:4276 length:405 start_codon:yes stop_codon:yes gene_type:complete
MVSEFNWSARVYFEDTDSGGVVYHANYLKFMERARTELLRELGVDQHQLKKEKKIMFVVHSMTIKFRAPARFDDELLIKTQCIKVRSCSMILNQVIENNNRLLIEAKVELACIDEILFKPTLIPREIKELMEAI